MYPTVPAIPERPKGGGHLAAMNCVGELQRDLHQCCGILVKPLSAFFGYPPFDFIFKFLLLSHAHNLITSDCAANFTVHKARKNVILGRIEVCHVNYVCIDFQEERLMFTSWINISIWKVLSWFPSHQVITVGITSRRPFHNFSIVHSVPQDKFA